MRVEEREWRCLINLLLFLKVIEKGFKGIWKGLALHLPFPFYNSILEDEGIWIVDDAIWNTRKCQIQIHYKAFDPNQLIYNSLKLGEFGVSSSYINKF